MWYTDIKLSLVHDVLTNKDQFPNLRSWQMSRRETNRTFIIPQVVTRLGAYTNPSSRKSVNCTELKKSKMVSLLQ
jgi:hypothetical protein